MVVPQEERGNDLPPPTKGRFKSYAHFNYSSPKPNQVAILIQQPKIKTLNGTHIAISYVLQTHLLFLFKLSHIFTF